MKTVYILFFGFVVILNSVELGSQSGQPGSSSSSRPPAESRSHAEIRSPTPEPQTGFVMNRTPSSISPFVNIAPSDINNIPDSMQYPLTWIKFQFPKNSNLMYIGSQVIRNHDCSRIINAFVEVRTDLLYDCQVNQGGDVLGYREIPFNGPTIRLYRLPHNQVAINIGPGKKVKDLNSLERDFLHKYPNGVKKIYS